MKGLGPISRDVTFPAGAPFTTGGIGDAFVASEGYKSIQTAAGRGQTWSSGPVDVKGT